MEETTLENLGRFNVGDTVRIVYDPYDDCPFGWVYEMNRYCGMEATIERKHYNDAYCTYAYKVNVDGQKFTWCEDCFIAGEEIDEQDFLDILGE